MQQLVPFTTKQRKAARLVRRWCFGVVVGFFMVWWLAFLTTAIAASELPIATTIPLAAEASTPGMVVRYTEAINTYEQSTTTFDGAVYGVVGVRPAIVFMTASNTTPVVTQGVTSVLVDADQNGSIARGDLLTTSAVPGVAMRADLETTAVFAVALEDFSGGQGSVMAEVGVDAAVALQQARQAEAAAAASSKETTSLVRMIIAVTLTLGALGFLLYSFRSILHSGILSVGRNPRARTSVVWISAGSMVMVVLLVTLVVLIAIGVLVLPV